MVSTNSRYASNAVILLNTNRGSVVTIAHKTPQPLTISYTFIRLDEGERIDHLAFNMYGDARLWWKIADANPEILDWTNVPTGTVLRVPSAY